MSKVHFDFGGRVPRLYKLRDILILVLLDLDLDWEEL